MTIREAVSKFDKLHKNQYSQEEKISWLSQLDGIVHREIILSHIGAGTVQDDGSIEPQEDFRGYDVDADVDTVLLVPFPYDEIYIYYLCMKVDENNNETLNYNVNAAKYNSALDAFSSWYTRTHMPLSLKNRFFF